MLWLIFAVFTAVAVVSVLWPLAKTPRGVARREIGIALYKAQLAEIERDEAQYLVAPEDARGAKAEVGRRLLAAEAAIEPPPAASRTRVRLVSVGISIFVPLLAFSLYATIGHPDMPDDTARGAARRFPRPHGFGGGDRKGRSASCAQHQDDGRAYEVLAPVYLRMGRAGEAADAARAALRLLGETPARRALYGGSAGCRRQRRGDAGSQTILRSRGGARALGRRAPLFLRLAAEQEGDKAGARDIWGKLVAEAPQAAPWAQALRERLAALGAGPGTTQNGLAAKIKDSRKPGG